MVALRRSPKRWRSGAVGLAIVGATTFVAGHTVAACLIPPVDAVITARFVEPSCPYCAGQRGLEFAGADGTAVRAAASGTVSFSGVVVGVRYVVVRHGDGLLATYGGLSSTSLTAGDRVAAGAVIGTAGDVLYFGLRVPATGAGPDTYVDPEPLLGELFVIPYLVPTDGSAQRPAPPPELRC